MAKMFLVVNVAILVLGIIGETSAQYRQGGYGYGHHSHPYYQHQRPGYGEYQRQPGFQQQPGFQPQPGFEQQLPGVSVQEAEWVCKNPKTGDMLIISSEDVPSPNTETGGHQQWQSQPNNPQPNPQPSFGEPTPPTPNYPTQSPQQPNTDAPNTNGEGLIEIRTRQ